MVKYVNVQLTPGELSGSGPRSVASPASVFVAYRFDSQQSQWFRDELERRFKCADSLKDVNVTDGRAVLLGDNWSGKIRDVLKQSRLVVAELTALSPEVLYECGLAHGFARSVLPIVADKDWYSRLPRWLTALQLGNFSNSEAWDAIIDTIDKCLNHGHAARAYPKLPSPDPGQAIWLPGPDWFDSRKDALINVANRYDMNEPIMNISLYDIENAHDSVIEQIATASLVVASVDNLASDPFVHYACGLVVSKGSAGLSKRRLRRRVILVTNEKTNSETLVCESARHAHAAVCVTTLAGLSNELIKFGNSYQQWRKDCEAPL